MKRQQIVLIVCGALMAVLCLGAGWFLFSAMGARSDAAEQRNQAYQEVKSIYGAKVFPSEENVARVNEDEKALDAWLAGASALVHKGDLLIETNSPAVFKQSLQATVRTLKDQPGAVKGKVVESDFKFGFDKYLGDSASLPEKDNVWRLTQQLMVIEKICKELYAANILSLETVQREAFDDVQAEQPREEGGSNRRPRRRDRQTERAAAAPAGTQNKDAGEFFSKQRYSFVFQARPAAFIEALNRLAAMELFVVVAETEFRKTDDPLMKRDTRKKDKDAKAGARAEGIGVAEAADLSAVPHVERIVTDPELEPPVSVKLDIDVYTFEGV